MRDAKRNILVRAHTCRPLTHALRASPSVVIAGAGASPPAMGCLRSVLVPSEFQKAGPLHRPGVAFTNFACLSFSLVFVLLPISVPLKLVFCDTPDILQLFSYLCNS